MQISVTFRNLEPADNIKAYVKTRLDRFDRFFNNPAEANVVLTVDKFRQAAEINIIGDRLHLIAKEETTDMYLAIDTACDKLDAQLKKNKDKLSDKRAGGKRRAETAISAMEDMEADEEEEESEPAAQPLIIEKLDYKPMDVEEALLAFEAFEAETGYPFLVFTNARNGKVNVIYRKTEGGVVLIEPN